MLWARGAAVAVDPQSQTLRVPATDQTATAQVRVRNLGFRPLKMVGAAVSCGCMEAHGVPATIPAGGEHTVSLVVHSPPVRGTTTGVTANFAFDAPIEAVAAVEVVWLAEPPASANSPMDLLPVAKEAVEPSAAQRRSE